MTKATKTLAKSAPEALLLAVLLLATPALTQPNPPCYTNCATCGLAGNEYACKLCYKTNLVNGSCVAGSQQNTNCLYAIGNNTCTTCNEPFIYNGLGGFSCNCLMEDSNIRSCTNYVLKKTVNSTSLICNECLGMIPSVDGMTCTPFTLTPKWNNCQRGRRVNNILYCSQCKKGFGLMLMTGSVLTARCMGKKLPPMIGCTYYRADLGRCLVCDVENGYFMDAPDGKCVHL